MKKYIFLILSLLSMHVAFAGDAGGIFLLKPTGDLGFKGLITSFLDSRVQFPDLGDSRRNKTESYPLLSDNDGEDDEDGFLSIELPTAALNNDPVPQLIRDNIRALREIGAALFFLENRIRVTENADTGGLNIQGPFNDPAFGDVFQGLTNPENHANIFLGNAGVVFDAFRANLLILADDVIEQLEIQLAPFEFNILTRRLNEFANQNPEDIDIIELEKLISAITTLRERIYQRPHVFRPNGIQGGDTLLIGALNDLEELAESILEGARETRSEDEQVEIAIQINESFPPLETEARRLWTMILDFQRTRNDIINQYNLQNLLQNYNAWMTHYDLNGIGDAVLDALFDALHDYIEYVHNNGNTPNPGIHIIEALETLGYYLGTPSLEESEAAEEDEDEDDSVPTSEPAQSVNRLHSRRASI